MQYTVTSLLLNICYLVYSTPLHAQKNWSQGAGGNANDAALAITHDNQGNFYTAGYLSQSAMFDNFILSYSGIGDVFIAKTDSLSNFIWVTKAGRSQSEKATGISVTPNSYVCVTGVYIGTAQFGNTQLVSNSNSQDIFVLKLNSSNGNIIWAKSFGGPDTDLANDVAADAQDKLSIVGQFKDTSQIGSYTYTSVNYPSNMQNYAGQLLMMP